MMEESEDEIYIEGLDYSEVTLKDIYEVLVQIRELLEDKGI